MHNQTLLLSTLSQRTLGMCKQLDLMAKLALTQCSQQRLSLTSTPTAFGIDLQNAHQPRSPIAA
jgi:hypothetical protein